MEKNNLYNKWHWENWKATHRRMMMDPYLTPYKYICVCIHIYKNSKWMKDLHLRPKTIKLLQENKGQNIPDIQFENDFLDVTPKEQVTKEKTDILDFMKTKKLFVSKNVINSIKR